MNLGLKGTWNWGNGTVHIVFANFPEIIAWVRERAGEGGGGLTNTEGGEREMGRKSELTGEFGGL